MCKCQYLKDFVFMLGFVSNYLFYYFICIDASFSEYVLIFLYLEGIREGTKLPQVTKSLHIQHLGSLNISIKLKAFPSPNLDNA